MQKTTIAPLSHSHWDLRLATPFTLWAGVRLENVSGLISAKDFELWRDYVSLNDRQDFQSVRYALVHDFFSEEHAGALENQSQDLLYRVFVLLRLIKPTRSRFSAVQIKRLDPKTPSRIEVQRFTHPVSLPLNMPESETLNAITEGDLQLAAELAPSFLQIAEDGPPYLRRSIRFYEEGYSEFRDPVLQLIVWLMGVESLMTRDGPTLSRERLFDMLRSSVPMETEIYKHWSEEEFSYIVGRRPKTTLANVLDDVFDLRDRFVHGLWVPAEWMSRVAYTSPAGVSVSYADSLRDAAVFLLRTTIRKHLDEGKTLDR